MERIYKVGVPGVAAVAFLLDVVVAVLAARLGAPRATALAAIDGVASLATVGLALLRPAVAHFAAFAAAVVAAPLPLMLAAPASRAGGAALAAAALAAALAAARWVQGRRAEGLAFSAPRKPALPSAAAPEPAGKPHPWLKRLGYPTFFLATFVFFLYQTFPFDQVRGRVLAEISRVTGMKVDAAVLEPSWVTGLHAESLMFKTEGEEPVAIAVDVLDARLNVLPLLFGRLTTTFRAELWGGAIEGKVADLRARPQVTVRASGIQLASVGALKAASGLELGGTLDLAAQIDVKREKELVKPSGEITLDVGDAELRGGKVMGMDLPRVPLGRVAGKLALKDGEGTVERIEVKNAPDLELGVTGTVSLRPRLASSPMNLFLELKMADTFLDRIGLSFAKMVMAQARRPDGAYAYVVNGTLGSPGIPRPNLGR